MIDKTEQEPLTVDEYIDALTLVLNASMRFGPEGTKLMQTEEMARFYFKHVVQPTATPAPEQEADLWRKLIADTEAQPCKYPCLRDDLADWLSEQEAASCPRCPIQTAYGPAMCFNCAAEQEAAQVVAPPGVQDVVYSYECRQPHTDPAVWCEFFNRNKPESDPEWVRNVRLYTAPVPATTPAEQTEGDSSHVMRPFGAPAGQHEVTRLDLLSLIHSQMHRVYASAIDREEVDTKYMAQIEEALRAVYARAELASGSREGRDGCNESGNLGAANTNKGGEA